MYKSVLASAVFACSLLFSTTYARLVVINPSEVAHKFENGQVKSKLSNVGFLGNQRGVTRVGQVISPLSEDQNGCQPYNWTEDFTETELQHFNKTQGFFVLVERGDCTFETKIKYAERFGAEVVLIADYEPGKDPKDQEDYYETK